MPKNPEIKKVLVIGSGPIVIGQAAEFDYAGTQACCGAPAKRETNTMPQWAGSSWYFLRYVDNKNDQELVSKEKADKYLPVDMYIGGVEHAVLHLLYSRFYTKFLYDIGVIDFDEPFKKLFNQGMITGKNGIKMSKSKGNVVSPDDLVRDYGCDALRMYELFVGPPELDAEWDLYIMAKKNLMLTRKIDHMGQRSIREKVIRKFLSVYRNCVCEFFYFPV